MDKVYICYMVLICAAAVASYGIIRFIDYLFHKREMRNEFAMNELVDQRRYRMAKGCILSFTTSQKQMALSLTKELNDNLLKMYKDMSEL